MSPFTAVNALQEIMTAANICPVGFFTEGQEPPFCHSCGTPWYKYVQFLWYHSPQFVSLGKMCSGGGKIMNN
jgi:hypothetical protein